MEKKIKIDIRASDIQEIRDRLELLRSIREWYESISGKDTNLFSINFN